MPYTVEWTSDGAIISMFGRILFKDLADTNEAVFYSRKAKSLNYVIWDGTRIDNFNALLDMDAKELGSNDGYLSLTTVTQKLKFALVSSDPQMIPLLDSYIQMHEELGSNWIVRKYDNMQDALSWVNQPV